MPAPRVSTEVPLSRAEWDLLVRLPRHVLIAAMAAEPDPEQLSVADGLAGIAAIAAGRDAPSRLVHDVVAEIYTESSADDLVVAADPAGRAADIAGVLAECRVAAHLLRHRVLPADAAAYRCWIEDVAAIQRRVPDRFLDELHRALE
jgi:hypothetical protein